MRGDAVLDGEIVAVGSRRPGSQSSRGCSSGCSSATRCGRRGAGVAVELYLFDCLFYEGIDLTGLPLVDRKKVLRDVVWYDDPIRFTPVPHHRLGGDVSARPAPRAPEGIIAKRADSRYVSARSTDWLKIKCVHQQEFVVGGYTAPQGSREHLGALLVGYYERGSAPVRRQGRHRLRPGDAGDAARGSWHRCTAAPRRSRRGRSPAGEVQWVTPKLVAQIGFGEWTAAGLLRHPRYLGLREDKTAREVRREEPKTTGSAARRRGKR